MDSIKNRITGFAGFTTGVYFFLVIFCQNAISQNFTESNLPIVLINTFGQVIPDEEKITGGMQIIDNGPGQINHITDPPTWYNGTIGIEVRGASSSWYPQKPYALETRDSLGEDMDVSLFGWPEESDYVMLSHYGDKSLVRNELSFRLFNETGHYASRYVWAEVMLNNEYEGIYLFGEKIKRDDNRVDIAKLTPDDTTGTDLTGGYIYKIDYWDWTDSWLSPYHPIGFPGFDIHYVFYYPKPDEILPVQKSYISNYVSEFEGALYSPEFQDPVNGYRKYIDVPSFIDYFLVNEVSRNNDGFKKSYYFNKDRDDHNPLIRSGPVWDFDWAWKNIDECYIFRATDGSGWAYQVNNCYPDVNSPGYYIRLFEDDAFVNAVKCRWEELRNSTLNTDTLIAWIDQKVEYLWDAQQRHFIRFPIAGNYAVPEVPPIPQTYQGEIDKLKQWITLRMNWLDMNMPGVCTTGTPQLNGTSSQTRIFPNPASEWVWIESPSFRASDRIRIYDLTGHERSLPYDFNGTTFTLDVKGLKGGLYFFRILDGNDQKFSGKFSVNKP
jgi:hypothetical protein